MLWLLFFRMNIYEPFIHTYMEKIISLNHHLNNFSLARSLADSFILFVSGVESCCCFFIHFDTTTTKMKTDDSNL